MPRKTRRYSIKVTDVDTGKDVILTAVDWTDEEKRVALAGILRFSGVPRGAGDRFIEEIAPAPTHRKRRTRH